MIRKCMVPSWTVRRWCSSGVGDFPPRKEVRSLGVAGAGQMGTGIGIVAAQVAQLDVVFFDRDKTKAEGAMRFADQWLSKSVEKGKLKEEEKALTLARLSICDYLEDFEDVDLVIEAASENIQVKMDLFRSLDSIVAPEVICATNTSSISITKVASVTKRPDKVIGMHFFNPVPVMKVIELVPGFVTSPETVSITKTLCEAMGKQVGVAKDSPGFVSNRLLMPYINEAIGVLADGVASKEDIDKVINATTPKPMGPLALADLIGLDTCLSIMQVLHSELGDSKYRPAPLLASYVAAGWLGRKTNRGFYIYES